jgi:hypothetical protein
VSRAAAAALPDDVVRECRASCPRSRAGDRASLLDAALSASQRPADCAGARLLLFSFAPHDAMQGFSVMFQARAQRRSDLIWSI